MNAQTILSQALAWLGARVQTRRWQVAGGASVLLVALLVAGFYALHQRSLAAPAGVSASACTSTAGSLGMTPPGVTLPVKIPAGEPRVVATVNGQPLCAAGLELEVAGILANHQQLLKQLQQAPNGGPHGPP